MDRSSINRLGNWSLGTVPTSVDNVTIPDASTTDNDPSISASAVAANIKIAVSFYNLKLNKYNSDDLLISGTVEVLGDFTQTDGELNSGQINLAGDYVIAADAVGISPNSGAAYTTINMNGSGDQAIAYTARGIGSLVRINRAGGTFAVNNNIVVCG
ncbi:MAG: hypothetical protein PHI66_02410 [Candidatus Pacebacteria bacterium]|nr:hypothetical protein [Candidatus Paceibacterota bacterium]